MSTRRFVNTRGQGNLLTVGPGMSSYDNFIHLKTHKEVVTKFYVAPPGAEEVKHCLNI